jgi:predicted phosphodiesterase
LTNQLRIIEAELLNESDRILVVGDLHGDAATLEKTLEHWDSTRDLLVLLGDYADRGKQSVEVIERVDQLIVDHPERVVGLRGNHEDYSASGEPYFSPCDLIDEVQTSRGSWSEFWNNTFQPFIGRLKLAAMIPGETLFVHGGVSTRIQDRKDLENPAEDVELDVLYSDPTTAFPGETQNKIRQCGVMFGPEITRILCERLGVKRIIRGHSHAVARFRPTAVHSGRVTTVISSSVFSSNPYVVVIDAKSPGTMQRMNLTDGGLTDIQIDTSTPPVDDGIPIMKTLLLDDEVKRAYDSLSQYCRNGNMSARFLLQSSAHLSLVAEEGCDLFQLPVVELAGGAPKLGDQRSLIVQMHQKTKRIVSVFYAPQPTAAAIRRLDE